MFELIKSNKRRGVALIAGFVLILTLVGAAFGALFGNGLVGTLVALLLSVALAMVAYWKADAIALRVSRATLADPQQYQRLHNIVEGLCVASGLPKPRVYVVDDPAPNAFATGRDPKHAAIVVTTGLLEKMNRVELEGVVAHELSHIRNYDIFIGTLVVALVGAPSLLSDLAFRLMWWNGGRSRRTGDRDDGANPLAYLGYVFLIFAPLLGRVMRATISRRRQTVADMSACQMTRFPPGLISALEKLRDDTTVVHSSTSATAHLWIAQPMSGVGDNGRHGRWNGMFDTHPPIEERIALLREL